MTDRERYEELLSLLSHGLIRYAEKHGLLEPSKAKKLEVVGSVREEAAKDD